jgi:manganese oxidase
MEAPKDPTKSVDYDKKNKKWTYRVVALEAPIFFNDFGDHNHDGMMFALKRHSDEIQAHAKLTQSALAAIKAAKEAGFKFHVPIEPTIQLPAEIETLFQYLSGLDNKIVHHHMLEIMKLTSDKRKHLLKTHPMVQPLVIRARIGDTVEVHLENQIRHRHVGMHLIAGGYGASSDGSHVGLNPFSSLAAPGNSFQYEWNCEHEGVFVFHDMGDPDGDEDGTNAHGLFGALIVEPENTWWTDPEVETWTSKDSMSWGRDKAHGLLAVDVHQQPQANLEKLKPESKAKCPDGQKPETRCEKYNTPSRSFREFVVFIHDEPENHEPHWLEEVPNPAAHVIFHDEQHAESGAKNAAKPDPATHGVHTGGSLMCINYRSEQMEYRQRLIHKWTANGHLEKAVLNEEQHHSSWLFGDPATPILRAYIGDPVRIRLVHAGVKETHVFHLHVYEWHSDAGNPDSPLIDAISISPGCGHTIEPLFGAGNVQTVAGDVIWHCHLYPHFHMGMWGMFRTFDTLQTGKVGDLLEPDLVTYQNEYKGRRIGEYPDGTRIKHLEPLPDRQPPPAPTTSKPGYPLFLAGKPHQKSPIPPWPTREVFERPENEHEYDYREPSNLEANAMQAHARPGELFTSFGHPKQKATWQDDGSGRRETLAWHPEFSNRAHAIAVTNKMVVYNSDGWHDPNGHFFYLPEEKSVARNEYSDHPGHGHASNDEGKPVLTGTQRQKLDQELCSSDNIHEPLFFRCQHGEVLELTLENRLKPLKTDAFDLGLPPTDPRKNHALIPGILGKHDFLGECGLHVHLVKFDPICADGASTGWNYISAPSMGKKMVYRWWADEEFGTIFFHDHLFANTRQRRGLFGALLVEPLGAKFHDPWTDKEIFSGKQAVIKLPDGQQFREFCVGIGDWIAAYDKNGQALEPPKHLGGHDDNGIMVVNYRSAPLKERGNDSSLWFSSKRSLGAKGDPDSTIFETFAGDPVWLRLIQGSHEEQHSFQIHGLRWNRLRQDPASPWRNQQTLGISEAFTFKLDGPATPGDYLWKLAGIDDSWLGCWGLIRAHNPAQHLSAASNGGPIPKRLAKDVWQKISEAREVNNAIIAEHSVIPDFAPTRKYQIVAKQAAITYRDPSHPDGSLIDPFGLYFQAVKMINPDNTEVIFDTPEHQEPLIIRAIQGEKIEITLENKLPRKVKSEPLWAAPELDLENTDEGVKNSNQTRDVSNCVSLHADMVLSDVRKSDGVTAGLNDLQHVISGETIKYIWFADKVGSSLLQDMADLRNHRRHGLIGALIIEPEGSQPLEVPEGQNTAPKNAKPAWVGSRATIVRGGHRGEEIVLILQDGLRLFRNGKISPDRKLDPEDIPGDPLLKSELDQAKADAVKAKQDPNLVSRFTQPDTEDQGQKAFNYRTALLDEAMKDSKQEADLKAKITPEELEKRLVSRKITQVEYDKIKQIQIATAELEVLKQGFEAGVNTFEEFDSAKKKLESQWLRERTKDWFKLPPATPTFVVPSGADVDFHLVCAADRPRNHSFTIHGHSWREYPHRLENSPVISAEPAISSGWTRTFSFKANADNGDYLYRSGVTKWAIAQGLWGILRVD